MKYRDYLIVPVLAMYLLYASCAYIGKGSPSDGPEAPEASLNPDSIKWASSNGDEEYWYANGQRGSESFYVVSAAGSENGIYFTDSCNVGREAANPYTISDMHLKCENTSGRSYDLIFLNEMTAYDTISGTYYQRADYDSIVENLTSGEFVNVDNPKDSYTFRKNGKSVEYFGDKVFKGIWSLETTQTVVVYDKSCKEYFHFNLQFAPDGTVSGFRFNDVTYKLAA